MTLEILAFVGGLVLTVLVPAVGWLVTAVIQQGRHIAAIEASNAAEAQQTSQMIEELRELRVDLKAIRGGIKDLCGDTKTLCERTDWLQRTADRHERFLDAGRIDPS